MVVEPVAEATLKEVTHTPGPWFINHERSEKHRKMIGVGDEAREDCGERNGGYWVAHAIGPDCEANARLIAASPKLLETARDLVELIDAVAPEYSESPVLANARHTISKATSTSSADAKHQAAPKNTGDQS